MDNHFDVIVIGAGISGIGAGYHLQTKCPEKSYAILEGRDTIGGTWDLFKYPGIRSDSDMYTLGFSFFPWKEKEAIAQKLKELGVEESLINLKGMTQGMLVILGQKNIKKLIDFADLSSDELIGGFDEIKGKKIRVDGYLEEFSLSRKEADELIMAAREIAYK